MALLGMVLCTSLRVGIQNGLTSKLFKDIEEMLLRLYYSLQEAAIVDDQCSNPFTRLNRRALQRIGAYIAHLETLTEG